MGFLAAIPLATWAAGASIAGSALAAGTSIVGGIMDYKQQNNQADAQEKAFDAEQQNQRNMADYNTKLAEQQAKETEAQTAEREARIRLEGERTLSMQRAMYGKSGAALTSGSPLAVLGETAMNNEISVLDARRAGNAQAADLRQQGQMYQYQGNVATSQKFYRPSYAGSLLSGIGGGVAALGQAGATYANYAYNPKIPKASTDRFNTITQMGP